MATGTDTQYLTVIDLVNRCPHRSTVTGFAQITGLDMIGTFARYRAAVMARVTTGCDIGVIDVSWNPA